MRRRLEPFLDLLDARYLPLLFAGVPQAYTVYAWLIASGAPSWVASMGGIGFEFVYVGSIAWAERGAGWRAARGPAITALAFSVAVAVAHYGTAQGALAALHAGFPLVAYFYTLLMHTRQPAPAHDAQVAQLEHELAQARADAAQAHEAVRHAQALAIDASATGAPQLVEESILVAQRQVSVRQLARVLELPESTVRRRVRRLEDAPAEPPATPV